MTFAKRATVFLLPGLLTLGFLEFSIRKAPSHYKTLRANLEAKMPSTEILIVGGSHFMDLPINKLPSPTFNLSNYSESLEISNQLIQRFLSQMPKLKLVVLELSYLSLEARLKDSPEYWRSFYYSQFLDVAGDGGLKQLLDLRNYSQFLLHGARPSLMMLSQLVSPIAIPTEKELPALNPNESRKLAYEQFQLHDSVMRDVNWELNLAALAAATERVLSQGIEILLVVAPVSLEYRANFSADKNERLEKSLKWIRGRFPGHPVYTANYLEDSRFSLSDYYDGHHLRPEPLKRFTGYLVSSDLPPILEKAPLRTLSSPPK